MKRSSWGARVANIPSAGISQTGQPRTGEAPFTASAKWPQKNKRWPPRRVCAGVPWERAPPRRSHSTNKYCTSCTRFAAQGRATPISRYHFLTKLLKYRSKTCGVTACLFCSLASMHPTCTQLHLPHLHGADTCHRTLLLLDMNENGMIKILVAVGPWGALGVARGRRCTLLDTSRVR